MIKGVNKQIVEINYTKNDYIEKAILIINPSKSAIPKAVLSKKADDYMKTITNQKPPPKAKDLTKIRIAILSILLSAAVITILCLTLIPI